MEELGLSAGVLKRLGAIGIATVGDLVALNPRELRDIPGIGERAVEQIGASLAAQGLKLAVDPWAPYVCVRHREASWDTQLAEMFLCDECTGQFVAQAFTGAPPSYQGEQVQGHCLHCNQLRPVRLRQWFLCGTCERVVRSIGRSKVADQFVLDWWKTECASRFPGLRFSLIDPPELRPREAQAAGAKIPSVDFICEDSASGAPLFGIELKAGRSYIRGRSIGTKMNQFQLDHGDVDDILAVVTREGNLPVYLFHVQVMDRTEPPTTRFEGLGLWWTDLFSMSEHYVGSRRRPREAKTAAYYKTVMFREPEWFPEHVAAGGPDEIRAQLDADGVPVLYQG